VTDKLSPRRVMQKQHALFLPLALVLLLGPLLALQSTPVVADQDAAGWHIETVDSEGRVGEDTSLALDESGYPHISYYDTTHDDLKHAYQDASGWHIETVDSEGGVGWDTSLALDRDGHPHISYHDDTNGNLKYAYQDSSGWHVETVDSEGYVGIDTSLALDEGVYPHISYHGNWALKYAYQDASGWHIETVDSKEEEHVGEDTSLALDRDGYPHISYYYCGGDYHGVCFVEDLKYVYQDVYGWHIETVDSEGHVGWYTSLALDKDRYPHISYCHNYNRDLKYAYQDASGWHIETVDSGWRVGQNTSLALDGDGYPHISYYDEYPNYDLKYAYQDTSGWHIETVDSEGYVGSHTSLAVDEGGYPHISYYNGSNGDLKYAYYSVAWLNWRDPDRPLLLPSRGTTVDVAYGNIPTPATLTATLSGPALFADSHQVLTDTITSPSGIYALHLKPAASATPGDTLTLEVTLDGLRLERVGAITWQMYLPLIRKKSP
jgi:hypothetical protein